MAVRIRLKKLGRRHRPYFRICVMDSRTPRDGAAIEEVGTYDPMVRETDKRVTMKADRVDYWLSVGAQPSDKVKKLIEKYKGKVPEERIDARKIPVIPEPPPPTDRRRKPKPEAPAEPAAAAAESSAAAATEASSEPGAEAATADETPAAEESPSE